MKQDQLLRYRSLFQNALNRKIVIIYKRTKYNKHTLYGKIIKLRKSSIKLLVGDEEEVDIGYRNIVNSVFLDSCWKIKYKLYYHE